MQWLEDLAISLYMLNDNATPHGVLNNVLFGKLDRAFVNI
jgi:hypothetical protein